MGMAESGLNCHFSNFPLFLPQACCFPQKLCASRDSSRDPRVGDRDTQTRPRGSALPVTHPPCLFTGFRPEWGSQHLTLAPRLVAAAFFFLPTSPLEETFLTGIGDTQARKPLPALCDARATYPHSFREQLRRWGCRCLPQPARAGICLGFKMLAGGTLVASGTPSPSLALHSCLLWRPGGA